ncbi:hypothetical protein ACLQ2J_32835 [Streptomyces cyaneofuscatus]|uniref:hypothetical protein n=1 Tax=Streptomyces cyaneofuscatus TaxID=66883 RepID=UPI003CEDA334
MTASAPAWARARPSGRAAAEVVGAGEVAVPLVVEVVEVVAEVVAGAVVPVPGAAGEEVEAVVAPGAEVAVEVVAEEVAAGEAAVPVG